MDFNPSQNYILENDFVKLSPLSLQDYDSLLYFSLNEPNLWKYSLINAAGEENLEIYLNYAIGDREKGVSYPFLVFDKIKNKVAGTTRFYDIQLIHNTLQLGYTWYGSEFQGTSLNKNCKFLMLEFAFETLKVKRVEFRADNNNVRSIAAMKSIGCTLEGVLRSNCASIDGRRDSIILSILDDEWFGGIKENLIVKCLPK